MKTSIAIGLILFCIFTWGCDAQDRSDNSGTQGSDTESNAVTNQKNNQAQDNVKSSDLNKLNVQNTQGSWFDTSEHGGIVKDVMGRDFQGPEFRVFIPEEWATQENAMGVRVAFMTPPTAGDTFRENINVVCENYNGMSFEEYQKATIDGAKKMLNAKIKETEKCTVGGLPAFLFRMKGQMGQFALDNDVLVIDSGKNSAYILTASMLEGESRSKYRQQLLDVMGTFELVEP